MNGAAAATSRTLAVIPPLLADVYDNASWFASLVLLADWFIRVGLSLRVVMRRSSVGVTLSWLTIVLLVPSSARRST